MAVGLFVHFTHTNTHGHTRTQHRLHLSACVDQQQVAHCAPLHPAEDVLPGGRAALSHQEVTAAGEQGLRLLASQPGAEGSQRGTDIMGGVRRVGSSATEMAALAPAVEPVLLLNQTLEQLELLATALRFHPG